ncbi:MAG: lipo-like protein [Betaproteobacteria bacterium]|nr:lipo-like protein [Betaproteobacteria bacterium]MBI2960747.1 lipo-like protein [Betaproteobacteria bacterium]
MNLLLAALGRRLADYLSTPKRQGSHVAMVAPELLGAALRPGDVLLVEGNTRISVAIKYLTQSTWSHATLFIGNALGAPKQGEEPKVLIEADIREGVRAVPLSMYANLHTRICRPVGLSPGELTKVIGYAVDRIGHRYDMKNVLDLARYLLPTPPVPARWRRRLLALGSGDPSRAICSTLIAQAFHSLRYPILPDVTLEKSGDPVCQDCYREVLRIRHYSLYTPRDFDISPYFEVVKPILAYDFDYRGLAWAEDLAGMRAQTP